MIRAALAGGRDGLRTAPPTARRSRARRAVRAAPARPRTSGAPRRSSASAAALELERLHELPTDAVVAPARARARPRAVVGGRRLPRGPRPLRARARRRPRARQARCARCGAGRSRRGETAELLEPYGEWAGPRERVPAGGLGAGCPGDGPARAVRQTLAMSDARSRSSAPARSARPCSPGCLAPAGGAGRDRRHRPARGAGRRAARAATGSRRPPRTPTRSPARRRRPRRQAAGHRGAARRDRPPAHAGADRLSVAAAIPTARIEARIADGVPGRARDAERAVDRARGHRRHLRRAPRRRRAPRARRGGAPHLGDVVEVPESWMDAITAVSGSGPAYFALLAEAMIEAGHPARPLARDLDEARRADDARHGEAAPRRGHAPGRAARVRHLAGRHDDRARSASSSRPASAPRSSTRSRPRWTAHASSRDDEG